MWSAEVDVFISNYTLVDSDIFQLWIEGFSSSEAVSILKQNFKEFEIPLIASDVLDHYRTYSLLERLLYYPATNLLEQQIPFQLEKQSRLILIEKYYSLDDSVSRELLGKKLSSRHRKDLDEVSERTSVRLKSCRRQFDNIKRIFKTVEEMSGCLVNNIKQQFLLSDELARKYAAIVFIACLRFETSKRKLHYLSFNDIFECSQSIMTFWTYSYQHSQEPEIEMDKEFLLDLRELRSLMDREKEIKHLVLFRLKNVILEKAYQELDLNFKSYWRSIITIAISIHRSRELRGFFVEITEKLIEPWKQNNWSAEQVKEFLPALTKVVLDLEVPRDQEVLMRCLFDRYMQVLSICLVKMYKN